MEIKFKDLSTYKCIYMEHHMTEILFKKIFYKIPFQFNEFKNFHSITFKHKHLQKILDRLEEYNYNILLCNQTKIFLRNEKLKELLNNI